MLDHEQLEVPAFARRVVGFIEKRKYVSLLIGLAVVGAMLPGTSKLSADFTHRAFFFATDRGKA